MPTAPTIISIDKEPIRLGQFLKLANLAQDGLEAKIRIQNGEIQVNGVREERRGKKLIHNDQISAEGKIFVVRCATSPEETAKR